MKKFHSSSLLWIILATCVILVATTNRYNYRDDFACGGRLGVGFPVSFLCDYGGGAGSPIDSWGRVDIADFPYFSLQGLFIDSLIYVAILFVIERLVHRIFHSNEKVHFAYDRWLAVISISFLLGYVFASFILASNQINFHNYILGISPTVVYSPTPPATLTP
jgi:hypothetical protein